MKTKLSALVIVIITLLVGLVYFGTIQARASMGIPHTEETEEIKGLINRAYTLFQSALRNGGDVSEFEKVFINTKDYINENDAEREFISLVLGNEKAEQSGYLSAMQAKYIAYGCGVKRLQDAERVANKENRVISQNEYIAIREACFGMNPPTIHESTPPNLDFVTILINGDRAVVRFDDGAALLEAVLIRQNEQWFIAVIKPIEIHF